jgi:hypothetical protein
MWYVHWAGPYSDLNISDLNQVRSTGAVPLVTWMSDDPSDSSAAGLSDAEIANGSQDAYITQWAHGLKAYGGPVLLRFDPEMNGNWFPWSTGVRGTTAAQYVAAWRHVHTVFTQVGASNVSWVWSPNVAYPGSSPIDALYPGDAYVDWMALDGYNWGIVDGHDWQSPATVFGASLTALTALSDKPVMLAEVGSTESGGDKATWIAELFALVRSEPRIRAFIWFDADKETDWRFDSTSASATAFRTGLGARP